MPSSRIQASDCDAKASLSSTRSMSSIPSPARLERLGDGLDGADAHHRRIDSGDPEGNDPGERLGAELGGALLRGEHEAGRAVVQRRGVARGDRAALAEERLQLGELLERGVRARPLVGLEGR